MKSRIETSVYIAICVVSWIVASPIILVAIVRWRLLQRGTP